MIQGVLKTLQIDNNTKFKNKQFYVLKNYKINQIFGLLYYPQCQRAVEGFNKIVENALDDALYNHKDWWKSRKKRSVWYWIWA